MSPVSPWKMYVRAYLCVCGYPCGAKLWLIQSNGLIRFLVSYGLVVLFCCYARVVIVDLYGTLILLFYIDEFGVSLSRSHWTSCRVKKGTRSGEAKSAACTITQGSSVQDCLCTVRIRTHALEPRVVVVWLGQHDRNHTYRADGRMVTSLVTLLATGQQPQ